MFREWWPKAWERGVSILVISRHCDLIPGNRTLAQAGLPVLCQHKRYVLAPRPENGLTR